MSDQLLLEDGAGLLAEGGGSLLVEGTAVSGLLLENEIRSASLKRRLHAHGIPL